MEKPLYPSPYMRITQGYMSGTHSDSYAIDDAGSDTGIDYIIAPFTGIIKKIYQSDANEVWLESLEPVIYPDGTVDYMTMLFAHDNDVSNLFVGKVIAKGERFYEEGTKGNASGNHVHMECGKGKFSGSGWHQNNSGYWSINNGKNPTECLWIDDSITVLNSNGYTFKKIVEEIPSPPDIEDNTKEEEETLPPTEDDSNREETTPEPETNKPTPRLIFTCQKDDTYAIELKKGQKLYLS